MSENNVVLRVDAGKRFQNARRKVFFDELLGLVRGRSPDLLSFEEVQGALKAWQLVESRQTEVIPLDKIVGSVGRYRDFTREFLPKESINEQRWRAIDVMMHSQSGLPPIDVFQVGDVYFVRDGNHRVSVARANGLTDIEAYVTRLETPVPLSVDTQATDLVLKASEADFLRETGLEALRPDAEVEVTEIGAYDELIEHIEVHQYYLGLEKQKDISWEEAVASWYDYVYLPVAAAVWASDLLSKFPGRTAADLYLWVCRHREDLARESGTLPLPVEVVTGLSQGEAGSRASRILQMLKRSVAKPKTTNLAAEAAAAAGVAKREQEHVAQPSADPQPN